MKILRISFFDIILTIVMVSFLVIGILIYKDYGISYDESYTRKTGLVTVKYIKDHLKLDYLIPTDYKELESMPAYIDYWEDERMHGVWFSVFSIIIEMFLHIKDFKSAIQLSHLLSFIVFYFSSIFVYKSIRLISTNKYLPFFIFLIYITNPRIFAESFYNTKDVLLLSIVSISIYFSIRLIKNKSFFDCLLASLFCGLAIATRIPAVILFLEVSIILILDYYFGLEKTTKPLKVLFPFLFLTPIFTIIFWPYLWQDPIYFFNKAYNTMKSYPWNGMVLFEGKMSLATELPWYYLIKWITITTPLITLSFLLMAIFGFSILFLKRGNIFERIKKHQVSLLIFGMTLAPIYLVISSKSIVYDGWRHLYFILAGAILAVAWIIEIVINKYKDYVLVTFGVYLILGIQIVSNIATIVQFHPYQNVYFNVLAGNNIRSKYEMDYWALTFVEGAKYILQIDQRDKIKLYPPPSDSDNLRYLGDIDFNRIELTPNLESAEYMITNFRGHPDDFSENKEIYCKIIKGEKIMAVYKLR